jgi:hypothetical protein
MQQQQQQQQQQVTKQHNQPVVGFQTHSSKGNERAEEEEAVSHATHTYPTPIHMHG